MQNGSFPAGWALMKPQQTIDPAEFERLWRAGGLIATRKRDGNRGHIITAGDATRIYSRNGTLDWTDQLGHLVHHWKQAPKGLLIDVELHTEDEGTQSFQSAMNQDPEKILWSAFDVLRLDGSLTNEPYRYRSSLLGQIEAVMGRGSHWGGGVFFNLPENATYDAALKRIVKAGCEGLVIWDGTAPHVLNTNGNTKRGKSWKIKPRITEDLVATRVNPCSTPSLGCGSINFARQIVKGQPLEPIKAPVGSFELSFDRHAALAANTPFVVEVAHYGEDDNGNLVFAKCIRARPDLHADFGLSH